MTRQAVKSDNWQIVIRIFGAGRLPYFTLLSSVIWAFKAKHFCRGFTEGVGSECVALPLHQYMLVLFDGDRACSEVDKPVFFLHTFSPHLAPHLLCVKYIFLEDKKHLG